MRVASYRAAFQAWTPSLEAAESLDSLPGEGGTGAAPPSSMGGGGGGEEVLKRLVRFVLHLKYRQEGGESLRISKMSVNQSSIFGF